MSLFPTPRIGRTFGRGMRIVPCSPSRHKLREGRTKLLESTYSPFLIKTALMNDDFEAFSGSCFCFCESITVSTIGFSLSMIEP